LTATTGSGRFTYRHRPISMPDGMLQHLPAAHSAFLPDRNGDGSTFFTLKGLGLLRLGPCLDRIEIVGGDDPIIAANIHGACFIRRDGEDYLGLPSEEAETVWITDRLGHIVRSFPNPYGPGGPPFKVTDLEMIDGVLYAANGYADNVCFTCDPEMPPARGSIGSWLPLKFGGQGTEHGRFTTAHGLTRVPGTNVLTIADRRNARLESFAPGGRYVGGLSLPPGSMPCSVDYHDRHAVVACLKGPDGSTPAPIYIFEDGNLVSEINIGRDLGLDGFVHIHNAAFRVMSDSHGVERFFVLAYAWNPGNLAVLEPIW
jgi:hypothetical protein